MKIETYQDGELIEIIEIAASFLPPNFLQFNTAMLGSEDYALFLHISGNELAKGRLELAAVRLELKSGYTPLDWQVFTNIWNMVANSISEENRLKINRDKLNIIASDANMPFAVNELLQLQILDDFT